MTTDEFDKLRPGKSVLRIFIDGKEKEVLFKFFICNIGEHYDGYWLVVTEDMSNPEPQKVLENDIETFFNLCQVIEI